MQIELTRSELWQLKQLVKIRQDDIEAGRRGALPGPVDLDELYGKLNMAWANSPRALAE